MKINFVANDGFPVERIMGKPIINFIRILIHTRKIYINKEKCIVCKRWKKFDKNSFWCCSDECAYNFTK